MHHRVLIVPFEPWHLSALKIQDEQHYIYDYAIRCTGSLEEYGKFAIEMAAQYMGEPCASTALVNGRIIGCAGIIRLFPHIGEAWAIFDKDFINISGKAKVKIVNNIKNTIRSVGLQRVQANTVEGFIGGNQFLQKIGMKPEGVLTKYGYDGNNHTMYSYTGE
jgi:RimJ/RimL family protein N-acetyltransferase